MKRVHGLLTALVACVAVGADQGRYEPKETFPGQSDYVREIKSATDRYDLARRRYEESLERARLNYIKILDDRVNDLAPGDPLAVQYGQEIKRLRSQRSALPHFEYKTYEWTHNAPAVKMIHKDDGFCYLVDISGAFHGGGERGWLSIGDDGYWYLNGTTAHGFLVLRAMAVTITR